MKKKKFQNICPQRSVYPQLKIYQITCDIVTLSWQLSAGHLLRPQFLEETIKMYFNHLVSL